MLYPLSYGGTVFVLYHTCGQLGLRGFSVHECPVISSEARSRDLSSALRTFPQEYSECLKKNVSGMKIGPWSNLNALFGGIPNILAECLQLKFHDA